MTRKRTTDKTKVHTQMDGGGVGGGEGGGRCVQGGSSEQVDAVRNFATPAKETRDPPTKQWSAVGGDVFYSKL